MSHNTYIWILVAILFVLAHFGREDTVLNAWDLFGSKADHFDVGLERPVDLKVVKVSARRSENDNSFVAG